MVNNRADVLSNSPYNDLFNRMNKIVQRVKDKYIGKNYFPIGTKKPFYEYDENEDIPESELVFYKFDTLDFNNASSNCFIGMAGTFKTTLIKSFVYYNSQIPGTKIGIMGLKGSSKEWGACSVPKKNPGMLFPNEPKSINIKSGCPLFALRGMPDRDRKKLNRFNIKPEHFADMGILSGLGLSPTAIEHLYGLLKDGVDPSNLLEVLQKLVKKKKIPTVTWKSMEPRIINLMRSGFFAKKDFFDLNEYWDNNISWALGFNNKEPPLLSVYVHTLLTMIYDRANSNKGIRERYFVVVDDALKAFGLNPEKYPSVQTGIDSLVLWRSVGINMNITAQSPTMLNSEIYGDIKHFFIYRCSKPNSLIEYIPNKKIIDAIKTLDYRPDIFISQCIHVFPDKQRYELFYPLNAPLSN